MIDRGNLLDRPIKSDLKTYDNIRKILKVMITQLDFYEIITISENTAN